jgi:hypothetical protein
MLRVFQIDLLNTDDFIKRPTISSLPLSWFLEKNQWADPLIL